MGNLLNKLKEDMEEFQAYADKIKAAKPEMDAAQQATVYGLFKQATAGDCDRADPANNDGQALDRFNAWTAYKGTDKEAAAGQCYRCQSHPRRMNIAIMPSV